MNNVSNKKGICAYCGEEKGITDDHIPPQCIFPKPRTTALIVVPCCEPCRVGWSMDDEEFRRFVWSAAGAEEHPSFEKAADKIISSINRLEAQDYRNRVLSSIGDIEMYSEAGSSVGNQPMMKLEWDRVERVLTRIVRGLFFQRNKKLIPDDHELIIKAPDVKLFNVLDKYPFEQIANICDGVFRYWLCELNDDKTHSLWLMSFCDSIWVLGYICPTKNAIKSLNQTK
ncbi:hypothetical protein [Methylobacter tundripaludum]|nr:hypothetical protein [Methylobacter tundripaludum]